MTADSNPGVAPEELVKSRARLALHLPAQLATAPRAPRLAPGPHANPPRCSPAELQLCHDKTTG